MPLLCSLIAFGVVSWLADNWVLPRWGVPTFGLVRDQWLTFAYVGGALILLARQPALLGRLGPISNAGRMAFTNYLLQIAALDLLFSGYAIGLGTIRPIVGVAAAVACFALEAWLSTIWLKHFRYGPAEWLWRAAAYGRLEPNRRRVIPPDAVRA